MKLLHTADLHLGQILYQYYERQDEHDLFFQQLSGWCHEHRPDALVVCGDVFDIPQPGAAVRQYFNHQIATLHRSFPEMAIVVIAGNHDSAARTQADSEVWGLSGVWLMGQAPSASAPERPEELDRYIAALPTGYIVALPFAPSVRTEVVQALLDRVAQRNSEQLPVVLCAHQAMAGADTTGHGEIGNQRALNLADLGSGYDYLALGHIHRPQTLGGDPSEEYLATSRYPSPTARYSGSALHVSCDEAYPHTASLVEVATRGANVCLTRLRIEQLRHFYTLPPAGREPLPDADAAKAAIRDFCATHPEGGYIRLRMAHTAAMPTGFMQEVYQLLEAAGGTTRYNPKLIFEGEPESNESKPRPTFDLHELQQMDNPLLFVQRIIDHFADLQDDEQLAADFAEIEGEVRRMSEEQALRQAAKQTKKK